MSTAVAQMFCTRAIGEIRNEFARSSNLNNCIGLLRSVNQLIVAQLGMSAVPDLISVIGPTKEWKIRSYATVSMAPLLSELLDAGMIEQSTYQSAYVALNNVSLSSYSGPALDAIQCSMRYALAMMYDREEIAYMKQVMAQNNMSESDCKWQLLQVVIHRIATG